jgi:hypothetical protein
MMRLKHRLKEANAHTHTHTLTHTHSHAHTHVGSPIHTQAHLDVFGILLPCRLCTRSRAVLHPERLLGLGMEWTRQRGVGATLVADLQLCKHAGKQVYGKNNT